MASIPFMTVVAESQVSPPPTATIVGDTSLAMTFIDISQLPQNPLHYLFFYQLPSLTKTEFTETIVPKLKHSLSITLQHFYPFAGNIILYPTSTTIKPIIRYVEGDSVKVTSAKCNLDFNDLTGYHPRNCDKFYHLIPPLGDYAKTSDYLKIPVFSLQITLFPNCGFSIGMTFHHGLVDASTEFCFVNAWTSIAQCGTDKSFLANGIFPFYKREINNPDLDDLFLTLAKVETLFDVEYQPPKLCGPSDKVRGTFILTRTIIDQLKLIVSAELPTLSYASSFTVTCAYIWYCLAKLRNDNDPQIFVIPVNARRRLDPPIPASYIGNCVSANMTYARTNDLKGNDGFITAAKLIGESLHNLLNSKDGILKGNLPKEVMLEGMPETVITISGTPKLKFYDMDFGWGKPKKLETISIDYGSAISIDAGKESSQDMEIGICLTATQMKDFVAAFNQELEP